MFLNLLECLQLQTTNGCCAITLIRRNKRMKEELEIQNLLPMIMIWYLAHQSFNKIR